MKWIVCQIGAREHYAIPRALHRKAALAGFVTDFWVPPGNLLGRLPGARRLRDRFHPDLAAVAVKAPNLAMLRYEALQRLGKRSGWPVILERNRLFQRQAIAALVKTIPAGRGAEASRPEYCLFSYSYAALELFRFAKARGWATVLGQIDPGPEEERIVLEEENRYAHLASSWEPAPASYWESWREEVGLADRIMVNSEWSRQCLLRQGIGAAKLEVVPLVYEGGAAAEGSGNRTAEPAVATGRLRVLFLGQIILRKGIGRLLEAMRMLADEPIDLILCGPTGIDPSAWADLPNVHWTGPLARSEVGACYREADVFILPTLSDGYALTQLEALSSGLPVIASAHCGQAVSHGINGWILEDVEPATLCQALRSAGKMLAGLPAVSAPGFGLDDLAAVLQKQ